jgi:hypothetical protein
MKGVSIMEELQQISTAVSTVGFPIIASYFMYKFATITIKENTAVISQLKDSIADLKATVQTILTLQQMQNEREEEK